ncbi:UNVERIFIED_CONTAM: hypothetical protein Slati_1484500 [Sesamum latifolium]|uniref:Uncharacterized protein n=1 Tax=Sesamum latifolium TaxID=2727402 RepID=A0AAW2X8M7_9LAMI
MSTTLSPSSPQPPRPDLNDRVARLEEWMRRMDPTWPDPPAVQPPVDPPVPHDDDEHAAKVDANLD